MSEQGALPIIDPALAERALTRSNDPTTSRIAASGIGATIISETQQRILSLLRIEGPKTDEQIAERWADLWPEQRTSNASLRSRRSELCRKGLVAASGDYGRTEHNRPTAIWRAL